MNFEKLVLDYVTKAERKRHLYRFKKKAPRAHIQKTQEKFRALLKDPKTYHRIQVENGKLKVLVVATECTGARQKKFILLKEFHLGSKRITRSQLGQELKLIKRFFKKPKLEFHLELFLSDRRPLHQLQKLGFKPHATVLHGELNTSLKKIGRRNWSHFNETYHIKPLQSLRPFKEMMDLEFRAHRADPTSVVHHFTRKDFNCFRPSFKKICQQKTGLMLFHQKKRIGHILYSLHPDSPETCFISTIALCPTYQGQGLGLYLYKIALEDMKNRGLKYYQGYTRTHAVLKSAKLLKRQPIIEVLKAVK